MATLTVGPGQQFSTIAVAINISNSGDTIRVAAGTYTNDFATITHSLQLQAVGGRVTVLATVPPNKSEGHPDDRRHAIGQPERLDHRLHFRWCGNLLFRRQ